MGRSAKREHLSRVLESHARTIQESFQMFEEASSSSAEKVEWSQVIKMGEDVSKQATITGMLWSGETPNVGELEENITVFCNVLQGFLLLSHGSTIGAGSTLLASILASVRLVIERSLALLRGSVSSYGIPGAKSSIPQLSGAVWEACTALKKTPTSNPVAIGRSITQVAVSVKDVLRELRELKCAETNAAKEHTSTNETSEENGMSDDEFGNDLSPEEMRTAQLVVNIVSDTLTLIKELIHFITGLLKRPGSAASRGEHVGTLEGLLKCCQEIGGQIDELGACVYPPQEICQMKDIATIVADCADQMRMLIVSMNESSSDGVINRCLDQLKGSLKDLKFRVASADADLMAAEVEKLNLST